MVLTIWDDVSKLADNFKEWVIRNGGNPIFYVTLFFIGIFIFVITYRALNKER